MPGCLGDRKKFEHDYGKPIQKGRDLDATDKEIEVCVCAHEHSVKT